VRPARRHREANGPKREPLRSETATKRAGAEHPQRPVPVAAVLTSAMGLAAFPIFSLAALSPVVVTDIGISRTQLGAVSTTMFGIGIIGSVVLGRLVDRVGAKRVLIGLFVTSSLAVALLASATTFLALLIAGVIVGMSQAAANPATNSIVSHHVAREHRGILMGVKQSGVPLAQFVAGGLLAPIAVVLGWRGAVLLGFVLIVPALIGTLAVLPASARNTVASTGPRFGIPPSLGWLFACTFFLAVALQATNVYLPLYAFEVVGASASMAGVLVGVVGVVGMVARILLGRAAGNTERPVAIMAIIGAVATAAVACIAAASAGGVALLWIGALAFGASAFGANVVGMTVIVRRVDASSAGSASGALSTVMFTGFAIGPLGFGGLVDLTGSYVFVWFLVLGICALSGAVALTVLWRAGRGSPPAVGAT
jgi:predicted MFS family arabinose efflux permease